MYNPFSLEGKNVLITGASSGIGKVIAIECSKLGAKVIITGRDECRLKETFSELQGDSHALFVADITDENQVSDLVDTCPPLDGIVNNAGVDKTLPVKFYNMNDLLYIFNTNFFTPTLITKSFLKKKKINKGASLVYISSISHIVCEAGNSIYGCSKAALEAFTKFAAKELANKLIRCNSVHPGMVETPLIHRGTISEEQLALDVKTYPLKRYGQPIDIANGVIYLLSDASSWVTGHSLVIDGGKTLK